jgi:hypothetical protein
VSNKRICGTEMNALWPSGATTFGGSWPGTKGNVGLVT